MPVPAAEQGVRLSGVTVFTFDNSGRFQDRIEAKSATVAAAARGGSTDARVYPQPACRRATTRIYSLNTNLSPRTGAREFRDTRNAAVLGIAGLYPTAENAGLAAAGYRLQYQKLLSRPFLLAAMVLLAAAFSLRFFRFGGVQKMVLGGVLSGFLLYVLSKMTEDMSKADLLSPATAAWTPVFVGALTGFLVLLYQEDG